MVRYVTVLTLDFRFLFCFFLALFHPFLYVYLSISPHMKSYLPFPHNKHCYSVARMASVVVRMDGKELDGTIHKLVPSK